MKNRFSLCVLSSVILALFLCMGKLQAQEKHYLIIQSENKLPFYVLLNNQNYSSTANGFVTISQLMAGKYYITIGFAKNQYPEQKFVVDVGKMDAGFYLRQNPSQEWVLFDWVNSALVHTDNGAAPAASNNTETANAAAINEKQVAANNDTQQQEPVMKVEKLLEKKSEKGIDQVYIDRSGNLSDTIAVFIPVVINAVAAKPAPAPKVEQPQPKPAEKQVATQDPAENKKMKQRNCNPASVEDFYRTRLDMAAAITDAAMLDAARKAFKTKCFTVDQVKNLGSLFLSEQSRFNFFELAVRSVSDPANFSSLVSELTIPSLIDKFSALQKSN
ncbi:MAG: DUF4476 domain-containing protein [Bacteroidota bacterium]|nr:DUF4476 domain-containing protein [Bacteroidota bacterium]